MLTNNIKIIKIRKTKLTNEIEIQGFDEDITEEYFWLINFMDNISKNKNIFVSSRGLEEDSFDKSIIINLASDLNTPFLKKSLNLKNISLGNVHKNIFESKYTIFFIFETSVNWNDFIITRKIQERKYFKEGVLIASISVGEAETVLISIRNDFSSYVKQFADGLQNNGYKIKKLLSLG